MELPASHGLHGALVEAQPEAVQHADVLHLAAGIDFDAQEHRPLQFGLARLLGVLGLILPQQHRRGDDAADGRVAAGDAAAIAVVAGARSTPAADTSVMTVADAAAVTRAAG